MCVSQDRLKAQLSALLSRQGIPHCKVSRIHARPARAGENVETVTSDGLESTDTAVAGDFLVENQTSARERYFVSADEFRAKYHHIDDLGNGWSVYRPGPAALVVALRVDDRLLELFDRHDSMRIEAPWGGTQPVNRGDYLVAPPDLAEIYRIGATEFAQTYMPADQAPRPGSM